MRVVLLPSDVDGKGYYRCLFPGRELGRCGHEVRFAPHTTLRVGGRVHLRYEYVDHRTNAVYPLDTVLGQLPFDVLLTNQTDHAGYDVMVRQLRAQGKRVIVDCDDDWVNAPSWNPGSQKQKQDLERMFSLLRAADALTVSTPHLGELYSRYNENVRVIRNALDWRMWADVTPVYEARTWRRLRVGWMGHLYWRRGDLDVLRGVLGPWLELNPDVEFVAAGDPLVHDWLGIPLGQRVSVQGSDFFHFDLADITAVMDIGLVPLAKNLLNEGKSHLKGLEYAACGIPCVASPSESYRWWVEEGVNGFTAVTPKQWWAALDELKDDVVRERMGRAARERAAGSTIQGAVHEWDEFLTDVCGSDREPAGTLQVA